MKRIWIVILSGLILLLIRFLRLTWRIENMQTLKNASLILFWHGDMVALAALRNLPSISVLISQSDDGELAARVAKGLGYAVIRGSTHRSPTKAAIGILRRLKAGEAVAIAADGPIGPAKEMSSGVKRLTMHYDSLQMRVDVKKAIRLSSWDKMAIPYPFSKVQIDALPIDTRH